MKKNSLLFIFFIIFTLQSFCQINPVINLNWSHWYQSTHNYFRLIWEEPDLPHGELIGYNIYRNNELFRFQSGREIYNIAPNGSPYTTNCDGESFLICCNNLGQPFPNGVEMHVTAVYNSGQIESTYNQSFFDQGLLLASTNFETRNTKIYPNPTKGIINIENKNLENIILYDITGKLIHVFEPKSQIDLSEFSKGLYILKLISDNKTIINKIVVE